MSEYLNRGPDPRPLGRPGAWLQARLSFHSSRAPRRLGLSVWLVRLSLYWPPFLAVAVRWWWGRTCWATLRLGWRWDENWGRGGYIADVIIKLREEVPHT